jgi:uncharacterized protein YfaQ (DUF2300 family)
MTEPIEQPIQRYKPLDELTAAEHHARLLDPEARFETHEWQAAAQEGARQGGVAGPQRTAAAAEQG